MLSSVFCKPPRKRRYNYVSPVQLPMLNHHISVCKVNSTIATVVIRTTTTVSSLHSFFLLDIDQRSIVLRIISIRCWCDLNCFTCLFYWFWFAAYCLFNDIDLNVIGVYYSFVCFLMDVGLCLVDLVCLFIVVLYWFRQFLNLFLMLSCVWKHLWLSFRVFYLFLKGFWLFLQLGSEVK